MKRLLLGIALASLIGSIAQAQDEIPNAQDIDIITDTKSISADLNSFVTGGTPPYLFKPAGYTLTSPGIEINGRL